MPRKKKSYPKVKRKPINTGGRVSPDLIDGRPTRKAIKARREFEERMRALEAKGL